MPDTGSGNPDVESIGEYLTNNVSRSIVYTLLISQPLRREEIEKSPVRASMREITYRPGSSDKEPKREVQLRTILAKGVNTGLLISYKSGGRNYYFLNSDLRIIPNPIGPEELEIEDAPGLNMRVEVESEVGQILGDAALPLDSQVAGGSSIPIPHIDSEKRLLLWLSWLSTPVKRKILRAISDEGSIKRPKLRKMLGFWADRLVVNEGIPSGILAVDGNDISFQYSLLKRGDEEDQKNAGGIRWIERPPSFMFTRTYEPLRCIHGCSATIEELKRAKKSPRDVLDELESAGRKIIARNRKGNLGVNFFEFASFVGCFDALPRFPESKSVLPLLIPDRILESESGRSIIWMKETVHPFSISKTQFALETSKIFSAKKAESERMAELEQLLRRVARERINEYLGDIEKKLSIMKSHGDSTGFSLGKSSLASYAALEMEKEELINEKKYAEKFFDLIFGQNDK